jgi:hypothetical protein
LRWAPPHRPRELKVRQSRCIASATVSRRTAAEAAYVPLPTAERGRKQPRKGCRHLMRFVTAQALADRNDEKERQQKPPDERTAVQPFFQGGDEHHTKSDAQQNDADQPSDRQRGGRGGIHARVSHGWREGGRTRMAAVTRRNRAWGISSLTPRIKLKARRHQCVGDG